jgi:peroxidase
MQWMVQNDHLPEKYQNLLCDEPKTNFSSRNLSAFVYVWGQFIDHDMAGTSEYNPIELPSDEPLFNVAIPFFRSAIQPGTGVSNKREQINQNTSCIDGSVVYGSDDSRAKWL